LHNRKVRPPSVEDAEIGVITTNLMLRTLKLATLRALKTSGAFHLVANSRWRGNRLVILCYHGTSLEDEHEWRPALYMDPRLLEQRFELLKRGRYSVLPLGDGLRRLQAGALPPRSVAITFDDGTYDFYRQAYPLLRQYGFPVSVYQTTYYMDYQRPVFNLICSYMLWKSRGTVIQDGRAIGLTDPLDLRTEAGRHRVVQELVELAKREQMTGRQKDGLAGRLARLLEIDYEALVAKRILHMMNAQELQEIARNGVDVQLHTHRHRTPENEELFRREISENRERIRAVVSSTPVHFCYPSGVYRSTFFEWLAKEEVVSATTCDGGLVSRRSHNMLIPRFIDSRYRMPIEFESWLSGVGDFLAFRRAATQKYIPIET
jgi:peptidoglycan/xylan/chitin deacetylase (PgdA/CDA1 family)